MENEPAKASPDPAHGEPKPPALPPPCKWAVHFAIAGDLRFLSHHDTMRLMERLAARARLPLRHSQGFNPRSLIWLPLPRPVGVATRDDLLVLGLEPAPEHAGEGVTSSPALEGAMPSPALEGAMPLPVCGEGHVPGPSASHSHQPLPAAELLARLNAEAPRGLRFLSARRLKTTGTPRPTKAFFEVPLDATQAGAVRPRLSVLLAQPAWTVERTTVTDRGRRSVSRPMDLRALVENAAVVGEGLLRFTLLRHNEAWARPAEVLRLLGLEDPRSAATAVRTGAEYEAMEEE